MPTRSWGPKGFGAAMLRVTGFPLSLLLKSPLADARPPLKKGVTASRVIFANSTRSASKLGVLLLKLILLVCISVGTAHAISYTYDELGRLKAVTDDAGNSAEYLYDPVGNIVQIKQVPSGTLSITEFTPNSGPIGASVTIFGAGFSTTAASNVVKFNGTTATVISVAINKLVVSVPAGATTGKITVTVGATTTTSIDDFVVAANTGAPTITGFTPTCAVYGSTVTLTGTNFDTATNATKVEIGNSIVQATVNSATSITLIAQSGISSGTIQVVTAAGSAMSVAPLLIGLTCVDLTPTTLTAPAQVGYQFSVSWTVQNSGTSSTSPYNSWNDRVYLSSDAVWDALDSQVATFDYNTALAAGASYTQTATASVPTSKPPGNYYLIVVTDTYGQVPETNETNNAKAIPISVVTPNLDLTPTTLTAPAQVGSQFSVSWTVQNSGTGSTSPFTWIDRVYLSSDAVWDALDSEVTALSYNIALAAGASYTQTATASVPTSKPPGNYYLIVVTDTSSQVPETNETNNAKAIPISVVTPDLDLTPTTLTAPAQVGYQFSVSWTVQNSGTSSTSPTSIWVDRVYLSGAGADTHVAALAYTTALAAGASYTQTATANVPIGKKPPGNYYLIVVVDKDGYVTERNETNNVKAIPISFLMPDLVPMALTAPAQVKVGSQFSVSWTVQNSGTGSTTPYNSWIDRVYLSSDAVWDASDSQVTAWYYGSALAVGASYTFTAIPANVPIGKPPGNYYLIVVTDKDGNVPEGNETNNVKTIPINLTP